MTRFDRRRDRRGTVSAPARSAEPPTVLRLREPGDLVAAVPHLVGFVPTDSLVLAAIHEQEGRPRLGAVARVDLPPPEHAAEAVGACARRMGRREPDDVALVVIGGEDGGGDGDGADPPHAELVELVEAMFGAARVPVRSRLWTPRIEAGAPWRCYPPCDCRGLVPDPHASTTAAAMTVLGQVTFASRGEVEELVRPDPEAGSAHRRRLVSEAAAAAVLDRELGGAAAVRRDHEALRRGARELAAGGVLGDVEIARLAVALTDPRVRDACLAWAFAPEPSDGASSGGGPDGVTPAAAEALWTLLTRAVGAPEVAEPAVLLAATVFVRGGGALLGAALERAWAAVPGHPLSSLLASLIDHGVGREEILEVLRGAGAEAQAALRRGTR